MRMARTLRGALGTERGSVHRFAGRLDYGPESVRYVRPAGIDDGTRPV